MVFPQWYTKFSYKTVGKFTEKRFLATFKDLQVDLRKAGIRITLIEYLSAAVLTSAITFIAAFFVLTTIVGALVNIAIGLVMGLIGGVLAATFAFFYFYSYPSNRVAERKKRVDDLLPFATLYLATIAGAGTPPAAMFKTLSQFKEYGEISEEAARIVEETELVGINVTDALKNAASRTPSDRFKEVLWGIMTTLLIGGDLKAFLHEKALSAMQEYRRRLVQFTQQLAMFIEMYITVVMVGSIFFMVLSTIFGGIGGAATMVVGIQVAITFLLLPVASIGFLILMKSIAPAGG